MSCLVIILCCKHLAHHKLEGVDTAYVAGRGVVHCAAEERQAAHSNSAGIESGQHSEASCAVR